MTLSIARPLSPAPTPSKKVSLFLILAVLTTDPYLPGGRVPCCLQPYNAYKKAATQAY